MADLSAWHLYRTLTVDSSRILDDLAAGTFTLRVWVNGSEEIAQNCRSDGFDIIFTDDEGDDIYPHEIEDFAIVDGKAYGNFWVRINDTVGSFIPTQFRLYYSNPDASDSSLPGHIQIRENVQHYNAGVYVCRNVASQKDIYFKALVSGTTHTSPPNLDVAPGTQVVDGTVTWLAIQSPWPESFKGVWHMVREDHGSYLTVPDSTLNEYDGLLSSTGTEQVDGAAGKAEYLSLEGGTLGSVRVPYTPDHSGFAVDNFTITITTFLGDPPWGVGYPFHGDGYAFGSSAYFLWADMYAVGFLGFYADGASKEPGDATCVTGNNLLEFGPDCRWSVFAITKNGSQVKLYYNGTVKATGSYTGPWETTDDLFFSRTEQQTAGSIARWDEVRIERLGHNAAWIQADYWSIMGAMVVDWGVPTENEEEPLTLSKPGTPTGEQYPWVSDTEPYETTGSECSDPELVIEYQFSWGDGSTSAWAEALEANKTWTTIGTFEVRVRARLQATPGILSEYSDPLMVWPTTERITDPGPPVGDTFFQNGTAHSYTTTGAVSNLDHTLEYRFVWGDEAVSAWSTGLGATHTWAAGGTYYPYVQARCKAHPQYMAQSTSLEVFVEQISQPGRPTGNPVVELGYEKSYATTGSTDTFDEVLQYRFNWGDGTYSTWSTAKSAAHTWGEAGPQNITVQARCTEHLFLSPVSAALTIMVRLDDLTVPGTPYGPAVIAVNVIGSYASSGSTSYFGHPIEYKWDWGNGTGEDWALESLGLRAYNAWPLEGTYNVTITARLVLNSFISRTSLPLSVKVGEEEPEPEPTDPGVHLITEDDEHILAEVCSNKILIESGFEAEFDFEDLYLIIIGYWDKFTKIIRTERGPLGSGSTKIFTVREKPETRGLKYGRRLLD